MINLRSIHQQTQAATLEKWEIWVRVLVQHKFSHHQQIVQLMLYHIPVVDTFFCVNNVHNMEVLTVHIL